VPPSDHLPSTFGIRNPVAEGALDRGGELAAGRDFFMTNNPHQGGQNRSQPTTPKRLLCALRTTSGACSVPQTGIASRETMALQEALAALLLPGASHGYQLATTLQAELG